MALSPPDLLSDADGIQAGPEQNLLLAGWIQSYGELWHEREELRALVKRLEHELAQGRAPASARRATRPRSRVRAAIAHLLFAPLCLLALAATAIMIAVVGGLYELDPRPAHATSVDSSLSRGGPADARSPRASAPATATDPKSARADVPPPAPRLRFRLTAERGETWLQARRGSRNGEILYEGLLGRGRSLRFREERLFLRLGAPGNLMAEIGGRPLAALPSSAAEVLIDARGLRVVSLG